MFVTLLSLALMVAVSLGGAHAAAHAGTPDTAHSEMPHEDHRADEDLCCDGLSARGGACLADAAAILSDLARCVAEPVSLDLAADVATKVTGHVPETPIAPPRA